VIVYCWDYQCDMNPRAAWRLDSLGFSPVYDYVAGKADWMAAGLPTEGASVGTTRIADIAQGDVPRCELGETVGQVRQRVADWDVCVVVNERDVVLGIVRAEALALEDDRPVAAVMQEGPSTFRPNLRLAELVGHLRRRGLPRVLVTRSDGTLVGLVRLEDVPDQQAANRGG
jgi:predicted transcriptional regulator